MIVVSDTTPLNYLLLIGVEDVLPRLFRQVHVPPAVIEEMRHPRAPAVVRDWAERPPDWVIVQAPGRLDPTLPPKLHRGEAQALSLALELRATLTLVDDWAARRAAQERNLHPTGTLSLLEEAACRDLIEIETIVERLKQTSYWAIEEQYQATIEGVRARKLAEEGRKSPEPKGMGP